MRLSVRLLTLLPLALAVAVTPSWAQSHQKKSGEDEGVQQAIAFERAKDRADAAQARKQARHPEQFTYAAPQQNPPHSLANGQKRDAMQHSEKTSRPQPRQ